MIACPVRKILLYLCLTGTNSSLLSGCDTLFSLPSYNYDEIKDEAIEDYSYDGWKTKSKEQEEAEKYCFEWAHIMMDETCAPCKEQPPTCMLLCRLSLIQAFPALCEEEGACVAANSSDYQARAQCTIETEERLKKIAWGLNTTNFQ